MSPAFLIGWRGQYASNFKNPAANSLAFEHRSYRRLTTAASVRLDNDSRKSASGDVHRGSETAFARLRHRLVVGEVPEVGDLGGAAEQVALRDIAEFLLQEIKLGFGFDAF